MAAITAQTMIEVLMERKASPRMRSRHDAPDVHNISISIMVKVNVVSDNATIVVTSAFDPGVP